MEQRLQQDVSTPTKNTSDLDDSLIQVEKDLRANTPKESYSNTYTDHMHLAKLKR